MQSRITRTYLAVPVHQTKLVESAARSQADAVFLDLEDAVPEAQKSNALCHPRIDDIHAVNR
jgi:malyl-CoA/(S)-citramalyl-CoA lyase